MPRPISATVNPQAIAHNLSVARRYAPDSFQWAVIKANAYGHGIERVFTGLEGADGLAMLDFDEAKRVRALGWTKPILMLEGCFDESDIQTCAQLSLTTMVHSQHQLDLHHRHPTPLNVQIKLNSGMNRLGFAIGSTGSPFKSDREKVSNPLDSLAAQLHAMKHLNVQMWVTHFADADVTQGAVAPLHRFTAALEGLFQYHSSLQAPISTSNSAAITLMPAAHHAAVRAGIMMYGGSPAASATALELGLKPAMQLRSQLIAIQTLAAGDTVGYGSTFTASQPMRVGVVACGYADGYPRHAPTGTPIAVNAVMCRTVGRVSMDMLTVDLSPVPQAVIGDAVELWGAEVPIDAVAQAAGTIAYELMCALAVRVPVKVVAF